jgi:hypothetical protein
VFASVTPVKGDPLLGQSFLSRLPSWAIDNAQNVLVFNDRGTAVPSPPPPLQQQAMGIPVSPSPPAPSMMAANSCGGNADDQVFRPIMQLYRAVNQRDIDVYAAQWADNATYIDLSPNTAPSTVTTKEQKIDRKRQQFSQWKFNLTMDRRPSIISKSPTEAMIEVYYSMSITYPSGDCRRRTNVLERYKVTCGASGQWQILENRDEMNVSGPSSGC